MNIQSICLSAGNYGCLCFCYLYLLGIDGIELIKNFNRLVSLKIIRNDCYVLDSQKFINFFSGKNYKFLRTDTEPKNKPYVANYTFNGKNHFVCCLNGEIVFNALDYSICASKGHPDGTFRYIEEN